jgi:hypothetical protein
LLAFDEDDMEDRVADPIFVQALQQKINDSKSGKQAGTTPPGGQEPERHAD